MPRGHHPYCKKTDDGGWMCELKNRKGNILAVGYGETRQASIDESLDDLRNVADHPLEAVKGWSEEHPVLTAIGTLLGMLLAMKWVSKY